jgi:hypothetical protein
MANRDFRNPNMGHKLLSFLGVSEYGTNHAPSIYDPDDLSIDYVAIGKWRILVICSIFISSPFHHSRSPTGTVQSQTSSGKHIGRW